MHQRRHAHLAPIAAACSIALLSVAAPTAAQAAGTIEVSYVKPQQFTDIGLGPIDRDHNLDALTRVFQGLQNQLPDGQTLKLVVTDVDLAGELQFQGSRPDLRVVRGRADWPKLELTYSLIQNDDVLKSGTASLSDPSYTFGLQSIRQDEPLHYERRMIDAWFKQTFVTR